MTTNFFQNIADLNIPGKWKVVIHTDDKGQLTVSALYTTHHNEDDASRLVPPMVLKGTAQELDEGFFDTITKPVQETSTLFHNMETYLKGLEEAKKQSQMEQARKTQELKNKQQAKVKTEEDGIEVSGQKENKEERKKRYEEDMKKVADFNDACKYAEAIESLPNEEEYPEKKAELEKKRADLERKKQQYDKALQLFNS